MRRMLQVGTLCLVCAAIAAVFSVSVDQAQARPPFTGVFAKKYPHLKDQLKVAKCRLCHPAENNKKKKLLTNYGTALKKALVEKNVKDKEKVSAMMTKIEKEPSAIKGKTFGDLIKEGKLPTATE